MLPTSSSRRTWRGPSWRRRPRPARPSARCTRRCSPIRAGGSGPTISPRCRMPMRARTGRLMIAFRDLLLRHRTLEATYLALVREGPGRTPPLFLNQLAHVILRNVLDGCDDPWTLRAAELFFRPQIVTLHEGSLLAADEETIAGAGGGPVSPLVSMLGLPAASAHRRAERGECVDAILSAAISSTWRSTSPPAAAASRRWASVIGRWVRHVLAVDVTVEPLGEVRDAQLHLVCRARRRGHEDRRSPVARRGARRGDARPRDRALRADVSPTRAWSIARSARSRCT